MLRAPSHLERLGGTDSLLLRTSALAGLRYTERLALEMALHEEAERRALKGELRSPRSPTTSSFRGHSRSSSRVVGGIATAAPNVAAYLCAAGAL